MVKLKAAVQLVQWEQQKSADTKCTQWRQVPGQGAGQVKGVTVLGVTSSEGSFSFVNIIKHKRNVHDVPTESTSVTFLNPSVSISKEETRDNVDDDDDMTILMCAQKLTDASLIYRTGPKTKSSKMKKN